MVQIDNSEDDFANLFEEIDDEVKDIHIFFGEAIHVKTVQRLPESDSWSADAVSAVRAFPRRPNPNAAEREPAPRINTEHEEGADNDNRDDGANLGEPRLTIRFAGLGRCASQAGCLPSTATQRGASGVPTSRPVFQITVSILLDAASAFASA